MIILMVAMVRTNFSEVLAATHFSEATVLTFCTAAMDMTLSAVMTGTIGLRGGTAMTAYLAEVGEIPSKAEAALTS